MDSNDRGIELIEKVIDDKIDAVVNRSQPKVAYGQVMKNEKGVTWVRFQMDSDLVPITRKVSDVEVGEVAKVTIYPDGSAVLDGSTSSPMPSVYGIRGFTETIITEEIAPVRERVALIEGETADISFIRADSIKVRNLTADEIEAATGYIGTLESESITTQDIKSATGYIGTLESESITTQDIKAATGYIADLTSENITANVLTANVGKIKNISGDTLNYMAGYIGILTSNNITTQELYADHGVITNLESNYAQIDMANVNNGWITNGVIKNAAISDEMVNSVSANKLTAGTIDAAKINVANLRAKNLIVEKLNGQPVLGGYELVSSSSSGYSSKNPSSEGWYEYSNGAWTASSDTTVVEGKAYYKDGGQVELYDQNYIDGLETRLDQRIDGAVETFTGSAVPSLVNYPASGWSSTQYQSHVGDIYYVIDPTGNENGYCYRFAYDSTSQTYGWVLIKDSDVTKALSDITDLQTFESETTSWIEETDEGLTTIRQNHTALSGVVDKTVKSSIQLWYTKNGTGAPNSPYTNDSTNHVTSTATTGNAWTTVVPAYNASYPNYFYCWQYELADGKYRWSAVIRDIAMEESQATGRYAKDKIDNLKIGGRNLVWDTTWNDVQNKWSNWGSPTTREIVTLNGKRWLHVVTSGGTQYQGYSQNGSKRNGAYEVEPSTEYTVSFVAYASAVRTFSPVGIHWRNAAQNSIILQHWASAEVTTEPQRFFKTFTTPANCAEFNIMVGSNDKGSSFDVWVSDVKLEKGNIATDWTPAPEDMTADMAAVASALDGYIDSNDAALAALQQQVDGQLEVWYGTSNPTTSNAPASGWSDNDAKSAHVGDLYYNTTDGSTWQWSVSGSTYSWTQIPDTSAAAALAAAQDAQATADGKRRIFTTTPTVPYDKGDLWVKGNEVRYANVKRETGSYVASEWSLTATDDTMAKTNIKSSVMLWYTNDSTTPPGKPYTDGSTSYISSTSTGAGTWTTVVPVYASATPKYHYCYQQQRGDGKYQWTTPVYDDATTTAMAKAQAALPASSFTTFQTTTFKELVDEVDEQSSTITTLSETVQHGGTNYFTEDYFNSRSNITFPYSLRGLTITKLGGGKYHVEGTTNAANADLWFLGDVTYFQNGPVKGGTWTMSYTITSGTMPSSILFQCAEYESSTWKANHRTASGETSVTFELASGRHVGDSGFYITASNVAVNFDILFQIEIGEIATPWSMPAGDTTTLSNTVNSVKQTADANLAKISNITTTLGTNADGTTADTDIMHRMSSAEQTLDGFTTTVSAMSESVRNLLRGTVNPTITNSAWSWAKQQTAPTWYPWNSYGSLSKTTDGVKLAWTSTAGSTGITVPFVEKNVVKEGEQLTLTFDYRTNMTALGAPYIINASGGNSVQTNLTDRTLNGDGAWHQYQTTWTATRASTDAVAFLVNYATAPSTDKYLEIRDGSLILERGDIARRVSQAETQISQNADAITLRATKTEVYESTQPNLTPMFASHNADGTYPDGGVGGYWQPSQDKLYGRSFFTALEDGWMHVNAANNAQKEFVPARVDGLVENDRVTMLVEWRNASWTGNGAAFYSRNYPASVQLPTNWTAPTNSASGEARHTYVVSSANGQQTWNGLINWTFTAASSATWTGDIRISFYKEAQDSSTNAYIQYAGPYKPYSGDKLYASQAELKVQSDRIGMVVSNADSSGSLALTADALTYIGNNVVINDQNGTSTVISGGKLQTNQISVSSMKDADKVVKYTRTEYYLSTLQTSLAGGSWQSTKPTLTEGSYLWQRTALWYANSTVTSYTTSNASAYQPDSTGVCTTVDPDIQIGGRNFLLGTGTMSNWGTNNNTSISDGVVTFPTVTADTWRETYPKKQFKYSLIRNQKVTFSVKAKADSGASCSINMCIGLVASETSTSRLKYRNSQHNFTGTGDWQKVSLTLDVTDSVFTAGSGSPDYNSCYAIVWPGAWTSYRTGFQAKEFKLELGNQATDWSPAPEDVAADISTAQGDADAALASMAWKGTTSTAQGTAAKAVTCAGFAAANLVQGATVTVYNAAANTSTGKLTLSVNSTTAKDVWVQNAVTSDTNRLLWNTGSTITYVYDGSVWRVFDNPGSWIGGTCSTAEGTAAKTTAGCFVIFKGASLTVPMENSNTSNSMTLNPGGLGASTVYHGTSSTSNNVPTKANGLAWPAGETVIFTYDGKFWRTGNQTFIDGGNIVTNTIGADKIKVSEINIGNLSGSIGGKNLLKNSATLESVWTFEDATMANGVATVGMTTSGNHRMYQMPANGYWTWEAETAYVVSVEAKGSSNSCVMAFSPVGAQCSTKQITVTTEWQRYSFAFTSATTVTTGSLSFNNAGASNTTVYFRNPKLEKGNVATDWSPAPEDAAADFSNIYSSMNGYTILWNRDNFTNANNGEAYVCKLDPLTGAKSDANGTVMWNSVTRTVPKGLINPDQRVTNNASTPVAVYNIPVYIVLRLTNASSTTGTLYIVWYSGEWRYAGASSGTAAAWSWTDATDIILGKYVETGSETAFIDYEIFDPPRSSGQVTTNTITAGGANSTANTANTKVNYYNRSCYVGNSSSTQTNYWRKFASITSTAANIDYVIVFDVVSSGDMSRKNRQGRLLAHLRTSGTVGTISAAETGLFWMWRGDGLALSDFVFAYKATSGTNVIVELWCRCPDSWIGYQFVQVEELSRTEVRSAALWTLHNSWSADGSASITSGYTLKNSEDTSNAFIKLDTDGIRIHDSDNVNDYVKIGSGGMDVYQSGVSVAQFTSSARIGKDSKSRFTISNNLLAAYNDSNQMYFKVTNDTLQYGVSNLTAASTSDLDAVEDKTDTALSGAIEYIVGTHGSTATNVWTGTTRDASIAAGKQIAFYMTSAGTSSAATLNLTLSGGGTTGAKNVRLNNSNVTTHYPQYTVLKLTYDGTYWKCDNYNSDTVNRHQIANAVKVGENITQYCIAGRNGTAGHKKLVSGLVIDLTYPIAYLAQANASGQTYAVASGSTTTNFYDAYPSVAVTNTKSGWTGTQYAMCYIKGTLSGNSFTVHSDVFTTTVPTSDDGFAYIPIGITYSTTQVNFNCDNTVYGYRNGSFHKLDTTSNYITADSNGIKVHKASDTKNYVQLTGSGMDVYVPVSGTATKVASFGSTAVIGANAAPHISIESDAIQFYKDASTKLAKIDQYADAYIAHGTGVTLAETPSKTYAGISGSVTSSGGATTIISADTDYDKSVPKIAQIHMWAKDGVMSSTGSGINLAADTVQLKGTAFGSLATKSSVSGNNALTTASKTSSESGTVAANNMVTLTVAITVPTGYAAVPLTQQIYSNNRSWRHIGGWSVSVSGSTCTYTVNVHNAGTSAVSGVTVTVVAAFVKTAVSSS